MGSEMCIRDRCAIVRCDCHRFSVDRGADRPKHVQCGKGQGRKSSLRRAGAGSGRQPLPVAAVAGGSGLAPCTAAVGLRCCRGAVSYLPAAGCHGRKTIIALSFTFWADGLDLRQIHQSLKMSMIYGSMVKKTNSSLRGYT